MNRNFILFITLCVFIFSGCAIQDDAEFIPPEGINDINDSLRLRLVEEVFSARSGTAVVVENVSEYELIYFSEDTDVYLYVQNGDVWLPVIRKETIYLPSADSYLRPSTVESPFFLTVSVKPLLPDLEKKTKLRVLVIGTVMENEQKSDQKVAAYIDLWVEP